MTCFTRATSRKLIGGRAQFCYRDGKRMLVLTEPGKLAVPPGKTVAVSYGVKFNVEPSGSQARNYHARARCVLRTDQFMLETPALQMNYNAIWEGVEVRLINVGALLHSSDSHHRSATGLRSRCSERSAVCARSKRQVRAALR